jgi:hypothetical protein
LKFLRQSTAATIVVGPFVDKSTALSLTTLTDQSAKGWIVKNGATGSAPTLTSWSHDAQGEYLVGITTQHTDTVGRFRISFYDATTYLMCWEDFSVLSQVVYDSIFGGVALSTYAGTAVASVTAPVTLTASEHTQIGTDVWTTPATRLLTAGTNIALAKGTGITGLNDLAAVAVENAVWDAARSSHVGVSSFGVNLDVATSTRMASYVQPTGFLAATFPSTVASTSPTVSAIATAVWQDATAADFTTANSIGKSIYNAFTANTSVFTTPALANAPSGTGASAAVIAAAVWDEAKSAHTTAGSFGVNLDAAVSTRSTFAGGAVASVAGAVGSVTGSVGSVTGSVGSVTGAVGSVTGAVAVASLAAGAISTTTFAAGATIPRVTLADTLTTHTGNVSQTGDNFTRIGALGVGLTALAQATQIPASLAGATFPTTVSSFAGGAVASVSGAVTVGTNNDKAGYSLATPPPTALQIAASVWQDTTAGDFNVVNSIGKSIYNAFTANTSVFAAPSLVNMPAMALTSAGLDAIVVETGLNARQALAILASPGAGLLSGAGSNAIVIKGAGVTTTRITATTDSLGNRTVVNLFPPA